MGAFCDFLRDKVIDGTLRNTPYVPAATLYLALYTSNPTSTGNAGIEVTGGSYARTPITFGASNAGTSANAADVNFPVATAVQGTVTHWVARDALTGGNALYYGAFDTPRNVVQDSQFIVSAAALTITLS